MGKICAAVGCNQKAPGSLFRFPHDPVRREKWLVLCDEDLRARERKVSQFQHRRLCWKHFEPWCFVDADNPSKGLIRTAVPREVEVIEQTKSVHFDDMFDVDYLEGDWEHVQEHINNPYDITG
ncbi:THAP domain-containing protein 2-like isoform X1 [Armigeres subalbatus]|uniref:THAP domain-containing protein 2-like isoform X1 n=1 Tax=Armigeres subalbatus TaxID=124917 RepID=UPI002ED1A77C